MHRSRWGTKENQQVILALRLRREFFERYCWRKPSQRRGNANGLPHRRRGPTLRAGRQCGYSGTPYDPWGHRLQRRAIQIGLKGTVLEAFGQRELLEVIDISAFVAEQRVHLTAADGAALLIPRERVYYPADPAITARLGLAEHG